METKERQSLRQLMDISEMNYLLYGSQILPLYSVMFCNALGCPTCVQLHYKYQLVCCEFIVLSFLNFQLFGHLLESQIQYYDPVGFWKSFRPWSTDVEVNPYEQQDAFDFFQALIDQLDDELKVTIF